MVYIEKLDYCGHNINQLIVDKSGGKNNHVLRFTERKMPGTQLHDYSVSVDWSVGQYVATMHLNKNDLKELIKNLQTLVDSM